jgi:hypothetical protein
VVIGSFRRDPGEVARARRMSAAALRSWGMDDEVPAIELAVSELVARAVRNGEGPAEMRLSATEGLIRLEVTDPSRREPAFGPGPEPSPWLAHGDDHGDDGLGHDGDGDGHDDNADERERRRGLGLWFVDEVADDWGVEHRPGATRVWLVRHRDGHRHPGVQPDCPTG